MLQLIRRTVALALILTSTLPAFSGPPILEARQGFTTKLLREERVGEAAEEPPASSGLKLISYTAPLGQNAAYVGADPGDGKKHPAIIWLVGGFSNSIGDIAWTPDLRVATSPVRSRITASMRQAVPHVPSTSASAR